MVDLRGVEPRYTPCESVVIPLYEKPRKINPGRASSLDQYSLMGTLLHEGIESGPTGNVRSTGDGSLSTYCKILLRTRPSFSLDAGCLSGIEEVDRVSRLQRERAWSGRAQNVQPFDSAASRLPGLQSAHGRI